MTMFIVFYVKKTYPRVVCRITAGENRLGTSPAVIIKI